LAGIDVTSIPPDLELVKQCIEMYPHVAGVIAVHCETASGIINNVARIGQIVKQANPSRKAVKTYVNICRV